MFEIILLFILAAIFPATIIYLFIDSIASWLIHRRRKDARDSI